VHNAVGNIHYSSYSWHEDRISSESSQDSSCNAERVASTCEVQEVTICFSNVHWKGYLSGVWRLDRITWNGFSFEYYNTVYKLCGFKPFPMGFRIMANPGARTKESLLEIYRRNNLSFLVADPKFKVDECKCTASYFLIVS